MTPFDDPRFQDEPALLDNRPPRGRPGVAWTVIIVVTVGVVLLQMYRSPPKQEEKKRGQVSGPEVGLVGKLYVGFAESAPQARGDLAHQIDKLIKDQFTEKRTLSIRDYLRLAVVLGELLKPSRTLEAVKELEQDPGPEPLTAEERRLIELLTRLYRGYEKKHDPNVLNQNEQEELAEELGWAGKLALAPAGGPDPKVRDALLASARNLVYLTLGFFLGGCGGLVVGIVVLILILIAVFGRRSNRGFIPGSPYGAIYAETFAVWIVAFVLLHVAGDFIPAGDSHLLVGTMLNLLSLSALAWPVMRGVPWAEVRQDVGLSFLGQGPRQVLSGPVAYLATWPLLLIGAILVFVLLCIWTMVAPGQPPKIGHPIEQDLANPSDWTLFQVYFAACFAAPLLEELLFRGVLYRHLREATRGSSLFGSFLISGLLTSLIFAVIHPQGLLAVPVLMSLAMGFTLAREWRGSIVPCVIAHGIHNGLTITLNLKMLGH